MLSVLNTRADHHTSCEDSVYAEEDDKYVWGVVADGCSSGIKSHFASQAIAYFIQSQGYPDVTSNDMVLWLKDFLSQLKLLFQFSEMNLLSTCILFRYNKDTKVLRIRLFGDGYYLINGVEYSVQQNNTPDYIAYHLSEGDFVFQRYLDKYHEIKYDNVDSFHICSDGIKSINRTSLQNDPKVDPSILFQTPTSFNYLVRMWNKLKRDGYLLQDDLTIVSYAQDIETQ